MKSLKLLLPLGDHAPIPFSRPLEATLLPLLDRAEKLLSGNASLLETPRAWIWHAEMNNRTLYQRLSHTRANQGKAVDKTVILKLDILIQIVSRLWNNYLSYLFFLNTLPPRTLLMEPLVNF